MSTPSRSTLLLSALLAAAGTSHFARPSLYTGLIPGPLGDPRAWVYASGAAELACAAGLILPRTRRASAWAAAGLFVLVFPGNVQMALDWSDREWWPERALAYARLPLQVPLVLWAAAVARGQGPAAPQPSAAAAVPPREQRPTAAPTG